VNVGGAPECARLGPETSIVLDSLWVRRGQTCHDELPVDDRGKLHAYPHGVTCS